MSLPVSTRDLEIRPLDLKRDRLPEIRHKVDEIDREMDDIIYNTIDEIQAKARSNDLRTFYYNIMADNGFNNRDFEDLVQLIADVIDIGVMEGRHREARDAVRSVPEDVIHMHIAAMTEEYRDLEDYVPRDARSDIRSSIDAYDRYVAGVEAYRRAGRRLPERQRDRDRGRDRYDDRDRGRGGPNYGSDRGSSRRDSYNRDAIRESAHGSRRNNRSNLYGNSSQSNRFEDDNDRDRDRGNDVRRDESRSARYDDGEQLAERSSVKLQRMPGTSRDDDITDALIREEQGSAMETEASPKPPQIDRLPAFQFLGAWLPSVQAPHPLVINLRQELFYDMDKANKVVFPAVVEKENVLNYYDHESMVFGKMPKDASRYESDGINPRISELHDAVVNPSVSYNIEGNENPVVYHRRIEVPEVMKSFSIKETMLFLNYRRFVHESSQVMGDKTQAVDLVSGSASVIEVILCTEVELGLLEELREVTSFTKLADRMRVLSRKLSSEVFLQVDRYLTKAVNRMLRQNLSIPFLKISSFTSDWLELLQVVTTDVGETFRDAIAKHQEKELKMLFNNDSETETFVLSQMPENGHSAFIMAMPTRLMYIKEVSFNLDLDMVPDVASQLLSSSHPFFHDLAQDLLVKNGAEKHGRFFIQTADMRTIEASRSYVSEDAILLRVIQ